jgi:hypothetical protein
MKKKIIHNTTYDVADMLLEGDVLAEISADAADKTECKAEAVKWAVIVNFAKNHEELIEAAREQLRDEHDIDCYGKNYVDGFYVAAIYVARMDADFAEEICLVAKQVAHNLCEEILAY